MKTIKETAKSCGVSKTTIERYIKEYNIKKVLDGNRYLIKEDDATLLKQLIKGATETQQDAQSSVASCEKVQRTETESETSGGACGEKSQHTETESAISQQYIDFLLKEIEIKNKTIDNLLNKNDELMKSNQFVIASLTDANRKVELLETELNEIENNKGFFSKLFKK